MKISGIIPARYASSRFPGKPLADIKGKPMIQWVYEQASKSKLLSEVIVATDDQRIFDCVMSFGGNVEMTAKNHRNGTERIAEVATRSNSDAFINVQGDEPFIAPEQIDQIAALLNKGAKIATLVKKMEIESDIQNSNTVKVARTLSGDALYFSRFPIPFNRNTKKESCYWQHIGIYGFGKGVLEQLVKLAPTPLEQSESLEQLRWLENGYTIQTAETDLHNISVDTHADLQALEKHLNNK